LPGQLIDPLSREAEGPALRSLGNLSGCPTDVVPIPAEGKNLEDEREAQAVKVPLLALKGFSFNVKELRV
jgi:hypothetical protein